MNEELNAADDIEALLEPDEVVEAVVFGAWGWGSVPNHASPEAWEHAFGEPGAEEREEPFVPFDKRGIVLSWEEAREYMKGWSFNGGYGPPDCYAACIWTNMRVMGPSQQYDGATSIDVIMPRNPQSFIPGMPGG